MTQPDAMKPTEEPKDRDGAEPKPSSGEAAQIEEAKDEGAGRTSIPIDQVTTENDSGIS